MYKKGPQTWVVFPRNPNWCRTWQPVWPYGLQFGSSSQVCLQNGSVKAKQPDPPWRTVLLVHQTLEKDLPSVQGRSVHLANGLRIRTELAIPTPEPCFITSKYVSPTSAKWPQSSSKNDLATTSDFLGAKFPANDVPSYQRRNVTSYVSCRVQVEWPDSERQHSKFNV